MWTPLQHTDFSKYSHAQLYAMLHAGVPARSCTTRPATSRRGCCVSATSGGAGPPNSTYS